MKTVRGILKHSINLYNYCLLFFFLGITPLLAVENQDSLAANKRIVETGIILDTLNNTVVLVLDENHVPAYYTSSVFTPVCAVGECYPIKINLFWTLAGSYLKYTLPENEILTKVDHIHFTPEDYVKLDAILRTKNSTLRYLYEDPAVGVDGITGATARASKRDYVEGAIYTSLTVYSLIHGHAVSEMKAFTKDQLIADENLYFFLNNTDAEIVALAYRWLAEKMPEAELTVFILNRFHANEEKHGDVALRFLSKDAMADTLIQPRLMELYLQTGTQPLARTYLLEAWKDKQLTTATQCGILTGFMKYKTDFELVVLTLKNQSEWSPEVYQKVAEVIREENNMKRKTELIHLLDSRKKHAPDAVKKYLKEIQKEMGL